MGSRGAGLPLAIPSRNGASTLSTLKKPQKEKVTMNKNVRALVKNTDGLSTVEYVIILILIAVVGIVAWRQFGNTVVSKINSGNSQVSGLGV